MLLRILVLGLAAVVLGDIRRRLEGRVLAAGMGVGVAPHRPVTVQVQVLALEASNTRGVVVGSQ